jgi:hypothetical protein
MSRSRRLQSRGPSAAALAIFIFPAACTTPADPVAVRVANATMEREASAQIRRCYRSPRVASAAKQISTTLRVFYAPDGTVTRIPEVLAQGGVTATNQPYARKMAEAAGLAVMQCAPLRLLGEPKSVVVIDFTFSPLARG